MLKRLSILAVIILLTGFQDVRQFTAKVVRIIDGDTIVVLNNSNEQVKVRLAGIDCPESGQDFGTQAKKLTSELCFGKQVKVLQSGTDRYGRVLGFIYVNDACVNEELLRQGMAWHYKQYDQDDNLAQIENTARINKIGLWSLKSSIAPWQWRKTH